MPKSVEDGFKEFHRRLVPSSTESEAARKHRQSIKSCLESNFGMTNFFRSGSFGNGTNVRNYSDVDYFASIPTANLKQDSSKSLTQVADALRYTFWSTSGIRVDAPAVVVPFGSDASETTEIIPADFISGSAGNRVYEIADGSGGWKRSSPDKHNSYVRSINDDLDGDVKPLIRFLKAWKYYKSVPISSFYLELLTAEYASGENTIVHSIDVQNVFERMSKSQLAAITDPAGISGRISACRTSIQKQDALSKVKTALGRAQNARESERKDNVRSAFDWWDMVFDGKFPAYG